ncbi:MAG: hypothetical protein ABSH04_05320, partial [Acidimicrobiales bacterium]
MRRGLRASGTVHRASRLAGPLAVAVAGMLLLAGCTAGTKRTSASKHQGPTVSSAIAVTTTTTEPPLPVTPVQWSSCGSDLECGSVTVPLDYSHPQGTTIQITVERHPALVAADRIGSLVINPGGPGGSGINDLPNELSVLT